MRSDTVPRERLFELRAILTKHGESGCVPTSYIAEKIDFVLGAPNVPLSLDAENRARADKWIRRDQENS